MYVQDKIQRVCLLGLSLSLVETLYAKLRIDVCTRSLSLSRFVTHCLMIEITRYDDIDELYNITNYYYK